MFTPIKYNQSSHKTANLGIEYSNSFRATLRPRPSCIGAPQKKSFFSELCHCYSYGVRTNDASTFHVGRQG